MSNITSLSLCFFVSICVAALNETLCPNIFPEECDDLDTALCNLSLVEAACPTTCQVYSTECFSALETTESCKVYNFLGPVAFIGYGIFLFLLVIIFVLSYSLCVDPKPLQRFSLKKNKKRDLDVPEVNPLRGRGEAELMVINPNRMFVGHSVTDPMRDIMFNSNIQARNNVDLEEKKGHLSPEPLSKIHFHDNFEEEEEVEGHFDPDDDFFKHHALIPADTSDVEPPLPPRIGALSASAALSQKARRKAERDSAFEAKHNSRSTNSRDTLSTLINSEPNSKSFVTPKVVQNYNQRLALNLPLDSNSVVRPEDEKRQPEKKPGEKNMYGEGSMPTLSSRNGYSVEAGESGTSISVSNNAARSSIKGDAPQANQKPPPPSYQTPTREDVEMYFPKPGNSSSIEEISTHNERKQKEPKREDDLYVRESL